MGEVLGPPAGRHWLCMCTCGLEREGGAGVPPGRREGHTCVEHLAASAIPRTPPLLQAGGTPGPRTPLSPCPRVLVRFGGHDLRSATPIRGWCEGASTRPDLRRVNLASLSHGCHGDSSCPSGSRESSFLF